MSDQKLDEKISEIVNKATALVGWSDDDTFKLADNATKEILKLHKAELERLLVEIGKTRINHEQFSSFVRPKFMDALASNRSSDE